MTNRYWRLDARPQGNDFAKALSLVEAELGEPQNGEIVIDNRMLSMDAGTRMWMTDRTDGYQPPLELGVPMSGLVIGPVIASRADGFAAGDWVRAFGTWSDYSIVDATLSGAMMLDTSVSDMRDHFGPLGMNGWTALWGLEKTGATKAGDKVLVSAAAGATGLLACQIAQLLGGEAYGIAGGETKCAILERDYGVTKAFDYRAGDMTEKLAAIDGGIDVYFDNIGGEILEAVLANMALYGRVAVCGLIAEYANGRRGCPANFDQVLMKRLRIEGFFSPDFMQHGDELTARLRQWVDAGELSLPYDVTLGLANTLTAYEKLFTGGNIGKVIVELSK
ncbi:MDR family NADP-dependent oxidoreductase [Parerythrobacter jejuensis]|uniref:Zinc-binding dehydrogenase n=2 Tax=Parerythrobacter jejuensis TaxID=795812 RepID=A0A845AMX5_9SPHN|nr:NADP-dependent oxidoreductase [Parerythrobacter jejuensis]MXP30245.1 zinc-binding dehydrogenase [Parerythrobacter jejuensis]MXP33005.1 zinc-binding dehydrogenase [Parerythrobacter jejuensis]